MCWILLFLAEPPQTQRLFLNSRFLVAVNNLNLVQYTATRE